jgi:hypothetical protein
MYSTPACIASASLPPFYAFSYGFNSAIPTKLPKLAANIPGLNFQFCSLNLSFGFEVDLALFSNSLTLAASS